MGMAFYAISKRNLKEKRDERGEDRKIKREMRSEAPVLAHVTEAAAGNVDAPRFGDDRRDDEDRCQRR